MRVQEWVWPNAKNFIFYFNSTMKSDQKQRGRMRRGRKENEGRGERKGGRMEGTERGRERRGGGGGGLKEEVEGTVFLLNHSREPNNDTNRIVQEGSAKFLHPGSKCSTEQRMLYVRVVT